MSRRLYPRLAWQNLRKNGKFYLPYILTIMGAAGSFYILMALSKAQDLPDMTRYGYLTVFLQLGVIMVGLFSIIFLFYTNSFLMKQRKKELGLYHVLGMGKRHIAKVLAWETLYTALLGILGGILLGMLFQRGVTALMFRLAHYDLPFQFYISQAGVFTTFLLFGAILLVNLLCNLKRIHGQNPVEMMREGAVGEREPKTRYVLAALGVITLGAGYIIAIRVKSAIEAFGAYFLAVLLVVIGTYCLFTAVSIAILKLLRKNKKFYYQTRHFIGLSGMLYRMKRNAVGLANICILSTMVLVMISGTLSLFLGTEDMLDTQYPTDFTMSVRYDPTKEMPFNPQGMLDRMSEGLTQQGGQVEKAYGYAVISFLADAKDGNLIITEKNTIKNPVQVSILTAQGYAQITGEELPQLKKEEILVFGKGIQVGNAMTMHFDAENGGDAVFSVASKLEEFPALGREMVGTPLYSPDICSIVVADDSVLTQLYQGRLTTLEEGYSEWIMWYGYFDLVDNTVEVDEAKAMEHLSDAVDETGMWESATCSSRAANAEDIYAVNGGFFFLGIFLGFLFLMAAVLIIYYKQITEGYEDRNRFQIMQKVGLDQAEIRRSVNSQVLVVFFAPLLVAAVHVAFDFRLVGLLLTLFGLANTTLTLLCTVGTLLAFMAVYSIVYVLTARVYYRIVS